MRDCVTAALFALPLMIMLNSCAGWQANPLQLLCLAAMYAASSMAIHISSWHMIAQIAHRKDDEETVHDGEDNS